MKREAPAMSPHGTNRLLPVLGVSREASDDAIKKAYRSWSFATLTQSDDAGEKDREINAATKLSAPESAEL